MEGYNICVFGKKGFGKTTWIRTYIEENPENIYFIYDHFEEYYIDEDTGKPRFQNAMRFSNLDDFMMYRDFNVNNGAVFVFQGEIDFDEFFELCVDMKNCVCVFDEIDKACSPTTIPDNLNRIIQYGRHHKVGLLTGSRRPANVHRNLTSQADEVICFRITEPRDRKYIEDFTNKEVANALPTLKIGQFLRYPPSDIDGDAIDSSEIAYRTEHKEKDTHDATE